MSAYDRYRDWPRQIIGPDDLFRVWYMEPAVFLIAVAASEVTAELVRFYMRPIDQIRRLKAAEIETAGGVATIADLRFTEFTKAARVEAKEYYKTSPEKGRIRARYMAISKSQHSTMNYKLLSMNASLMVGHLPIVAIEHPDQALSILGAETPVDNPEINKIQAAQTWT